MGSFGRMTVSAGAALAAVGMLTAASPASQAMPGRIVKVQCSAPALAAAISAANALGPTTVRLAPHCVYDITRPATSTDGLPVITGHITLLGGTLTTIQREPAAAAFRILEVASGGVLHVVNVSLVNGSTTGLGGGLQIAGDLTLFRTTVSGNVAANGGGLSVNSGARATVVRSLITGNATGGVGGGAALNFGTLTVVKSVLSANSAPINGGAVNTQPPGVTLLDHSVVEQNTSGSLGGGLSNLGTTSLVATLVRRNHGSAGGGIATANKNVTLAKSPVENNIPDNCSPRSTISSCVN